MVVISNYMTIGVMHKLIKPKQETKMGKEEIYEVGDVIETTKGKGKVILRDRVSDSPIITLEGEWVYMLEDDNGKMIGPIKWYEIKQR